MKQTIITKIFSQMLIGIVLSILYMQIRPYESYTLKWPFSFLGVWFLLWAWFAYLRYDHINHDRFSFFEVTDRYKKQIEESQVKAEASYFSSKSPNFMNYIFTPIGRKEDSSEVLKIRMISNSICFILFILLSFIV